MANPDLKNGYVRLANEIYEALARFRIPGEARQVLDFIIRKTYGWNKAEDRIPLSQFVLATGMGRSAVCRAIHKLVHMNMIIKKETSFETIYRFNKDFEAWHPLSKKRLVSVNPSKSTKLVSKKITASLQKDNFNMQKMGQILKKRYPK